MVTSPKHARASEFTLPIVRDDLGLLFLEKIILLLLYSALVTSLDRLEIRFPFRLLPATLVRSPSSSSPFPTGGILIAIPYPDSTAILAAEVSS
jgi:hypothetical protein